MIRSMLKSLLKPEAYPDETSTVELIQTHVSYIFLTELHAYKIKKPVDFGFLNFSTIDRRRFYCNEEVRLNRRLSPDVYLGVVELRATENGASFLGDGQVIDYAVKMKRLPADRMLDKLVSSGDVNADSIREIARHIADFHGTAPTSPSIEEYGRLERIMYNWSENFEQVVQFESTTIPASDREYIRSWVTHFSTKHDQLFQDRVNNGFIRECDGDIHLENICLDNGNIRIFDCIEFNERFRCCDTAADIAFLLMDLDYHGRHDLSDVAITEYLSVSNDGLAAELIDFYKIYRAFVRGKVESFRLNDDAMSLDERTFAEIRAKKYFRLAKGYILRKRLGKTLFLTCGLMGSGKSELAAQLAFELGLYHLNSDIIRKQLAGVSAEKPVKDPFNQGMYTPASHEQTYAELLDQAEQHLSYGHSVIIDACFPLHAQREAFSRLAARLEVTCIVLHLDISQTEIKRRLIEREGRGTSVSDGRLELLAHQTEIFELPISHDITSISLSSAKPPHKLADKIYSVLNLC